MTSEASSWPPRVRRIAVLGAAHVGPVIARVAATAGYRVAIAASRDPERSAVMTRVLAQPSGNSSSSVARTWSPPASRSAAPS
jgi:predicted dinucleotide-binding enzyme